MITLRIRERNKAIQHGTHHGARHSKVITSTDSSLNKLLQELASKTSVYQCMQSKVGTHPCGGSHSDSVSSSSHGLPPIFQEPTHTDTVFSKSAGWSTWCQHEKSVDQPEWTPRGVLHCKEGCARVLEKHKPQGTVKCALVQVASSTSTRCESARASTNCALVQAVTTSVCTRTIGVVRPQIKGLDA
jgi:hypothetical protein